MFFIFTYVMSRVTHSEPGLPMINGEKASLLPWLSHRYKFCLFTLKKGNQSQLQRLIELFARNETQVYM